MGKPEKTKIKIMRENRIKNDEFEVFKEQIINKI